LLAALLAGIVAAVAGAVAFGWPFLTDPSLFLAWGWVAFFVGPAVALAVWAATTPAFYSMLTRGSATPWVVAGMALLPVIGVWLWKGEELSGVANRRWTEEVLLADGSVVLVERSARIKHSHIVELDTSMKFTAELAHLPELRVPVVPLVLYRDEDTGEWVIVATTSSCEEAGARSQRYWFVADRPQTRYFEFRSRDVGWVQTPLSAKSIGQQANLFTRFEETKVSHLTVPAKVRLGDFGPEYRSVVERPQHTCGRNNYTQGIWDAEDQALAALDRENATAEQRARVGELLAATRFVPAGSEIRNVQSSSEGAIPSEQDTDPATIEIYAGYDRASRWQQDTDPSTVEVLSTGWRASAVSDDGQVIYVNGPDRPELIKESYSRRLRAAGLAQFAE
jgi:hypothetical protein